MCNSFFPPSIRSQSNLVCEYSSRSLVSHFFLHRNFRFFFCRVCFYRSFSHVWQRQHEDFLLSTFVNDVPRLIVDDLLQRLIDSKLTHSEHCSTLFIDDGLTKESTILNRRNGRRRRRNFYWQHHRFWRITKNVFKFFSTKSSTFFFVLCNSFANFCPYSWMSNRFLLLLRLVYSTSTCCVMSRAFHRRRRLAFL